jgi:DNA-binding PadR family transcriptional regulator
MRLLVLGLLMEGNKHPYEIRQTIKARNWNESFKLRDGSLYYAVDQLREDGLVEAAEIVPVPGENRPDKTIFRITEAGREAFIKLVYKQFEQSSYPQHPVFKALPFVRHCEPDMIISLIEKQITCCEERLARLRMIYELKSPFIPGGSSVFVRGCIQFSETELSWLNDMLAEAHSGKLFEGPKWTAEQIEAFRREMGF